MTLTATNNVGSSSQQLTVVVSEAPAITSPAQAVFVVGSPGSFTVATTGYPDPAITASPLPPGLSLTDNGDGTATLAGTPTGTPGTTTTTLTVENDVGKQEQQLAVVVRAVPAFTNAGATTFDVGVAGSFVIRATGSPTPSITTGDALPPGLT